MNKRKLPQYIAVCLLTVFPLLLESFFKKQYMFIAVFVFGGYMIYTQIKMLRGTVNRSDHMSANVSEHVESMGNINVYLLFVQFLWSIVIFFTATNQQEALYYIFLTFLFFSTSVIAYQLFGETSYGSEDSGLKDSGGSQKDGACALYDMHNKFYQAMFCCGVICGLWNIFVWRVSGTDEQTLYRFESMVPYANALAVYFLVCIIIGAGLLKRAEKDNPSGGISASNKKRFWLILSGMVVLIFSLMMTFSRMVWGLSLGILLIWIIRKVKKTRDIKKRGMIFGIAGVFVLSLCAVMIFMPSVLHRVMSISLNSTELNERFAYYYDACRIWKNNTFFGLGPGGWSSRQYEFQTAIYSVRFVHNAVLQRLMDGGTLNMLLFILISFLPTVKGMLMMKRGEDEQRTAALRLPVILNVILLLHACFDMDFEMPYIYMLLLVNNAMILKIGSQNLINCSRNTKQNITRKLRNIRVSVKIFTIIICVAAIFMMLSTVPLTASEYLFRKGMDLYYDNQYTDAMKYFEDVVKINPFYADSYYMMAFINKDRNEYITLEMFEQAEIRDIYNPRYALGRVEVYRKNKEYERALAECERFIMLQPMIQRNYILYIDILAEYSETNGAASNKQQRLTQLRQILDKNTVNISFWAKRIKDVPGHDPDYSKIRETIAEELKKN